MLNTRPQPSSPEKVRVAVLWQGMSGFFNASLRSLTAAGGDVALAYSVAHTDAPFDEAAFSWLGERAYRWAGAPDSRCLEEFILAFRPHAVLVSSWHIAQYRQVLGKLPRGTLRVLCMDNQWRERPKQWLGRVVAPMYLAPYFDTAFVPGDRQALFARKLGFRSRRIWRGLLCADTVAFTPASAAMCSRERCFLFVGRLVHEKSVELLLDAYRDYRASVAEPWRLRIVGAGPLEARVRRATGVDLGGFIQPEDLPMAMWSATTLVLPSRFEPWGVVVHEAATAGLSIVTTDAVGAAAHLVQDGYNGLVVPVGCRRALSGAMKYMTQLSDARLADMERASRDIAAQLTIERWGRYVIEAIATETRS